MAEAINVRALVLETLMDIHQGKRNASEGMYLTLKNYQYMSKQERSFYTRLCEGILEYEIQLDYMLDQISKVPMQRCKPYIRNILRMGAYQIYYMDAVPVEAACNEAVKLAKKKGFSNLAGFVNGVLRNFSRQRENIKLPQGTELSSLSIRYSMPQWLVECIIQQYGLAIGEKILEATLRPAPLTLRVNELKTQLEPLMKELQDAGIGVEKGAYAPNSLRITEFNYLNRIAAFREGRMTVQDESSILHGFLPSLKPGAWILDLCGAPGGKSFHLRERLTALEANGEAKGRVITRDLTLGKIQKVQENIDRLEYEGIELCQWDALEFDPTLEGKIDVVVCDLPCSGMGIMGRKKDIKYQLTKAQLEELVLLQRRILKVACRYLKPQGELIYSTCTLNQQENVEQVKWLKEECGLVGESVENRLPQALVETVGELPYTNLQEGYLTLIPGMMQCDGFFMSVLKRK